MVRDFNVSGSLEVVRESVSDAADKIRNAMAGAASAADHAADELNEASRAATTFSGSAAGAIASAEGMDAALSDIDVDLDDVNMSLEMLKGMSDEARQSLRRLGEVDLHDMDTGQLVDLRDESFDPKLLESEVFTEQLVRRLEPEEGKRAGFGGRLKGSLRSAKGFESVGDLVDALDRTDVRSSEAARILAVQRAAKATGESLGFLADSADEADDNILGIFDSSRSLTRRLVDMSHVIDDSGGLLQSLGRVFDKTSDDSDEFNRYIEGASNMIDKLLLRTANLSANIGPFNVALGQLGSTVGSLALIFGPLVSILSGLAAALGAVVAAFGAMFAVGALDFVESLKEQFAGIEDTGQAVEAIMKGLFAAVKEAVAPLRDAEIAGLGPMDFFVQVLRDTITLIHMFSEGVASLLSGESGRVIDDFLLRMRDGLLGIGDAGSEATGLLEAVEAALIVFLPVLGDILVWLGQASIDLIMFSTKFEDLIPVIGRAVLALIDLLATLAMVGKVILKGALPVFTALMWAITGVIKGIGTLTDMLPTEGWLGQAFRPSSIVQGITMAIVAMALLAKAIGLIAGTIAMWDKLVEVIYILTGRTITLRGVLRALVAPLRYVATAIAGILGVSVSTLAVIAAIVGVIIGFIVYAEELVGVFDNILNRLRDFRESLKYIRKEIINIPDNIPLSGAIEFALEAPFRILEGITRMFEVMAWFAREMAKLFANPIQTIIDWANQIMNTFKRMVAIANRFIGRGGGGAGRYGGSRGARTRNGAGAMLPGSANSSSSLPGQQNNTNVVVNVDNSGSGNMGDQEAQKIGRTVSNRMRKSRIQENG